MNYLQSEACGLPSFTTSVSRLADIHRWVSLIKGFLPVSNRRHQHILNAATSHHGYNLASATQCLLVAVNLRPVPNSYGDRQIVCEPIVESKYRLTMPLHSDISNGLPFVSFPFCLLSVFNLCRPGYSTWALELGLPIFCLEDTVFSSITLDLLLSYLHTH